MTVPKFLLRLSVMDAFTTEQARYVTEENHAGEILKKLRRENAFISCDEAGGVYKIHNVPGSYFHLIMIWAIVVKQIFSCLHSLA